jgi:hypothetical protein
MLPKLVTATFVYGLDLDKSTEAHMNLHVSIFCFLVH